MSGSATERPPALWHSTEACRDTRSKASNGRTFAPTAFVACGLLALNFQPLFPVIGVSLLAIAIALAATRNPYAWALFVAGSQAAPDPVGWPVTIAQAGAIAWFFTLPWNFWSLRLTFTSKYVSYCALLTIWYCATMMINQKTVPTGLLTAVVIGAITYQAARRHGVKGHYILLALVLGCGNSVTGFWALRAGVPVITQRDEGIIVDQITQRIGSGRGDANMAAMNLTVFMIGTFSAALFSGPSSRYSRTTRRILQICGPATIAAGIPPLLATVSRTGIYSFVASLAIVVAWAAFGPRTANRRSWRTLLGTISLIAFCVVAGGQVIDSGLRSWTDMLLARNRLNEKLSHTDSVLAGRSGQWLPHVRALWEHPVFGIANGDALTYDEAAVGIVGTDVMIVAHNAFLQFGSYSGIPGMFLFLYIFFRAPIDLVRKVGIADATPFLAVLLAVAFLFMGFPAEAWKTYWALLAIILAFSAKQPSTPFERP